MDRIHIVRECLGACARVRVCQKHCDSILIYIGKKADAMTRQQRDNKPFLFTFVSHRLACYFSNALVRVGKILISFYSDADYIFSADIYGKDPFFHMHGANHICSLLLPVTQQQPQQYACSVLYIVSLCVCVFSMVFARCHVGSEVVRGSFQSGTKEVKKTFAEITKQSCESKWNAECVCIWILVSDYNDGNGVPIYFYIFVGSFVRSFTHGTGSSHVFDARNPHEFTLFDRMHSVRI